MQKKQLGDKYEKHSSWSLNSGNNKMILGNSSADLKCGFHFQVDIWTGLEWGEMEWNETNEIEP
jgi:hypothetical protein